MATAKNTEITYVVGDKCTFMHNGKHYKQGMVITAAAFASEARFKLAIKQGKIVPAPVEEAETAKTETAKAETKTETKTEGTTK